mmetsp:Transcript_103118/g.269235  ORF Transcript_103118/g.269235 Transcript_103118/m.269235 type:complete len:244 (+) Transcript_103118:649-1380(+)
MEFRLGGSTFAAILLASSSSFSRFPPKMPASKALPSMSFVETLCFAAARWIFLRSASQSFRICTLSQFQLAASSTFRRASSASLNLPMPFSARTFLNQALWSFGSRSIAASAASSAVCHFSNFSAAWALFFRQAMWCSLYHLLSFLRCFPTVNFFIMSSPWPYMKRASSYRPSLNFSLPRRLASWPYSRICLRVVMSEQTLGLSSACFWLSWWISLQIPYQLSCNCCIRSSPPSWKFVLSFLR